MKQLVILCYLFASFGICKAQGVGIGTTTPHPSAKLEVKSNNSGFLLPRLSTAERKGIVGPAVGLLVFDTDKNAFMYWNGTVWQMLVPANASQGSSLEVKAPSDPAIMTFGYQVAVSNNFAAISASDNQSKRVYVFEKSGGNWIQRQEITSPDAGSNMFGYALDMDADYLLISDYGWKNAAGTAVGKVYLYRLSSGKYVYNHAIAGITTNADGFGRSVAVSLSPIKGLRVAVGMSLYDAGVGKQNAGRVILYRKTTTSWVLEQTIQPTDLGPNSQAGFSIDLDENVLVVGAPFHLDNKGRTYIYEHQSTGATWLQTATALGTSKGDLLGYSVSVSGTSVASGAPSYTNGINGRVFLHKKGTDGTWKAHYITEPTGLYKLGTIYFGYNVKLEQDYLLVGAPSGFLAYPNGTRYGREFGKAILYKLRFIGNSSIDVGLQWVRQAEYAREDDSFATSVGLSSANVIISNHMARDNNGVQKGAVVFNSYDPQ